MVHWSRIYESISCIKFGSFNYYFFKQFSVASSFSSSGYSNDMNVRSFDMASKTVRLKSSLCPTEWVISSSSKWLTLFSLIFALLLTYRVNCVFRHCIFNSKIFLSFYHKVSISLLRTPGLPFPVVPLFVIEHEIHKVSDNSSKWLILTSASIGSFPKRTGQSFLILCMLSEVSKNKVSWILYSVVKVWVLLKYRECWCVWALVGNQPG